LAEKSVLPSFHDDYLIGYEVDCKGRQIKLRIKSPLGLRSKPV